MGKDFIIRKAQRTDADAIHFLIKEHAAFENMPESVHLSIEDLQKDGFSSDSWFKCIVAESTDWSNEQDRILGLIMYYKAYSSWQGRMMFVDDLFVTPRTRGKGVGSALLKAVAQEAVSQECSRLEWVCNAENSRALQFYEKQGASDLTTKEGWNLIRLSGDQLQGFASC